MAKWMLRRKSANYTEISKKYNIDPLVAMLIANRGIEDDKEFNYYINGDNSIYHNPWLLKDMDKLISELKKQIDENNKIRIIGDYDVDGVCAAAILKKGLDLYNNIQNNSAIIDAVLPHRIKDGYGLNISMIEKAAEDKVDVILTCDNGISAVNEIAYAKTKGIKVLVTDHHEIPFETVENTKKYIYPDAEAIVDHKRTDCEYPYKEICGAFLAYKVIEALLPEDSFVKIQKELKELACVATIADIMNLSDENRFLVKQGLIYLEKPDNVGLKALVEELELTDKKITTYHVGFLIGPSINASGRVESADFALELLLTQDEINAKKLASKLRQFNDKRKELTEEAVEKAICDIENNQRENDKILVIYIPDCHESVAGIVAGKLKTIYSKPCICISDSNDIAKGSGRSIEAYNMYEELTKEAKLFIKYGGHSMAAGFSLKRENIDLLRTQLNNNCKLSKEDCQEVLHIDADLPLSYMNEKIMKELEILEPLGEGNPSCMFARKNLRIVGAKFFGENDLVGRYKVIDTDGKMSELTLFRKNAKLRSYLEEKYGEKAVGDAYLGKGEVSFSAAYYPKWNEYNGRKNIQLIIEDFC